MGVYIYINTQSLQNMGTTIHEHIFNVIAHLLISLYLGTRLQMN